MELLSPIVLASGVGNAIVAGQTSGIQYNAEGLLGADNDLTWNPSTRTFVVNGSVELSDGVY